ncbi:glycosyltransferase [Pantoea agglomerans]|uniref:glycosyltransferase family 4 protein n=1 Tax=Enterobacter agglomerans TaxID=549 RepID=UPI0013C5F1A1|nr:glycosyltransferase family 1 protein [Pantoea agglomerans]NEG61753.1 glycosyltransferase [Pantoea agglomerans]
MHILFDMQSCQSESRLRGIGRYSLSLVKAVIRNSPGHRVSILLNGLYPIDIINTVRKEFKGLIPEENIYIFSATGPLAYCDKNNHARNNVAKICRDLAIANINPDVICNTSFSEGFVDDFLVSVSDVKNKPKQFSIVYDLIPLLNKDVYLVDENFKNFYMNKLLELEHADGLLAISESAAREVKNNTEISPEKVTNISSAIDSHFKKIIITPDRKKELCLKYNIHKDFVMTIGVLEPRKNIEALIHAFSILDENVRVNHTLVLACQIKPHDKERLLIIARKHGLNDDDIAFTGFIPDDDLVSLYNICKLFVFPSIHEGFGLPPLEAMSCGAATIASNTTSLPEVMGWHESMFDPRNVNDISALMQKALIDDEFRHALANNAKKQASKFSWDISAQIAIDAFEKSLNKVIIDENIGDNSLEEAIERIINSPSQLNDDVDVLGTAWSLAKNSFQKHERKLLVDISVLVQHDARTGIQRVVRSVLSNLISSGCNGYVIRPVYCRMGELFHYANNYLKDNYDIDHGNDEPVFFNKDDILLGLDLTAHLFPYLNNQINTIRKSGAFVYYVVYDIIPLLHPDWTDVNVRAAFPVWLKSISENADGLVCISHSVAQEVDNYLNEHKDSINRNPYLELKYFHLGADISASKPFTCRPDNAAELLDKLKIQPTFLMVSTIEPRKGHEQVLLAFEKLWNDGIPCNLVIVGKKGWGVDNLIERIENHVQKDRNLHWLNNIGDDFLSELYVETNALIVASYAEGFGLPIIEAAQQELPIIARDIPVLREIAGDNAYYFNGNDPESVYSTIKDWIEMERIGTIPDSRNINWCTWKESTVQLLQQLPLVKQN